MVRVDLSVLAATRRDLEAIGVVDRVLSEGSLAALALRLAEMIDDPKNSATSRSMCSGQLRDTMAALWALAPAWAESDRVSSLEDRARLKLAGRAS